MHAQRAVGQGTMEIDRRGQDRGLSDGERDERDEPGERWNGEQGDSLVDAPPNNHQNHSAKRRESVASTTMSSAGSTGFGTCML